MGGIHVVGKYTDIKEADDVAGKTAEMDNAETVLIYVRRSNGEFIGSLAKKGKSVPHAYI
ncbi:MAG: hypothetical protein LUD72_13850 [Bacteroidales bacterium]|nr:hypothetical protein [Bacteroidales bacterium]